MKKYCLVSDDSGHSYVIPSDRKDDWYKFCDMEDWNVPEWAKYVEGDLEFERPSTSKGELFEREIQHYTREQYKEAMSYAMENIEMIINDDGKPFKSQEDAEHLAEIYYPHDVIIETEEGNIKCRTMRSNAWQPDGQYFYWFNKQI